MIFVWSGQVQTTTLSGTTQHRRRMHSSKFKAELVARCQQPGVSITAIALDHDLHPSLLHRWVTEHERYGKHSLQDNTAAPDQALDMTPANWIAVKHAQVDDHTVFAAKAETNKPAKIVDAQ